MFTGEKKPVRRWTCPNLPDVEDVISEPVRKSPRSRYTREDLGMFDSH